MASITFNTSYSGTEIDAGAYASTTLGNTFTGSGVLALGTTYALTGTVTGTGSVVTLKQTVGQVSQSGTATYDGYFTNPSGTFYVFSSALAPGGAFIVSSTGSVISGTFTSQNVTAGLPTAVCFLAGTGIATAKGVVAVEALQPGDLVATTRNGSVRFDPVRWIGHGRVQAGRDGLRTDDAPVRVGAGALRDGVPTRDLLVTQEHCLLIDEVLIPARMLVNQGSITLETGFASYSYFHVELERHAILIADGAEAESYLDTGNRTNFHNAETPSLRADFAHADALNWPEHAAAPLAVDRAIVEPIWNRLAERARTLGFTTQAATADGTAETDAELRIVTEAGREILPMLTDGQVYAFMVPPRSGALRLRSRSARPSETVGPFLDDRRTLGVQVGRIGVGTGSRRGTTERHLAASDLPGWYATEGGGTRRWTDGDALLPIEASVDDEALFLDIEVTGAGPYLPGMRAA